MPHGAHSRPTLSAVQYSGDSGEPITGVEGAGEGEGVVDADGVVMLDKLDELDELELELGLLLVALGALELLELVDSGDIGGDVTATGAPSQHNSNTRYIYAPHAQHSPDHIPADLFLPHYSDAIAHATMSCTGR